MTALPRTTTDPAGTAVSTVPDLDELHAVSRGLETQPATAAIEWAWDRFGTDLVLAASFQDCVMIDLAAKVAPGVEVAFLDTGYHFAETLWYVEHVRKRYDINLRVISAEAPADDLWLTDPDGCCAVRKVGPLKAALAGRAAWMSGLRRADGRDRVNTPVVTYDVGRGLVKVNPIALWSDLDVEGYVRDHGLPVHPLADRGYASIGCWPCTRPVAAGEDARAGRWAGTDKTECGLHG